jgi:hypothetical protein
VDYGRLIQQAWSLTWRYRFLWLLGILAGGGVGLPALNGNAGGSGAIAAEDVGPVAALRSGWRLLRLHIGESLLAWLINVALAIGAAIALVAGVLSALLALLGVGAAISEAPGFDTPTFVYMGLAALALLAVGLTLVGVANTFFWNYWTLAYLRLSGRAPATA